MRNWTALAAALFAASLAVGCSDETGVLVEVTRDPASTPADIETLSLVIGVSDASGRFIKDGASVADVAVTGRDLASSPYQLLLRDGTGGSAQVTVAVMAFKGDQMVGFAGFDAPQAFISGQVLMRRLTLVADAAVQRGETGCLTWFGPGDSRHQIAAPDDQDCDGDRADVDCDDANPQIGPSQTEICDNGIDDNCNDQIDEETDTDQDGVTNCAGDCRDNDATVHPGAEEICDGKDNDCSDVCDDGVLDKDGDLYNTCGEKIIANDGSCVDIGVPDCDDGDAEIHPGAEEICDGADNDCDGTCDVGPGIDEDGDGLSQCGTVPGATCTGPLAQLIDCNDDDPTVHPGATEVCDGKDTDCNGAREQHEPCYNMNLQTGECRLGSRNCDDDGSDGSFGLDACMANDGNVLVPTPLCDAYATCEATVPPPPDLFTCANDTAATGNNLVKCQLFHVGTVLCGERQAPLPTNGLAQTCNWQILGGQIQDHYNVGLFAGGGAQTSVGSCNASFGVVDKLDFIPRQDTVYLEYSDDTLAQQQTVEVQIAPVLVTQCPQSGLACTVIMP